MSFHEHGEAMFQYGYVLLALAPDLLEAVSDCIWAVGPEHLFEL